MTSPSPLLAPTVLGNPSREPYITRPVSPSFVLGLFQQEVPGEKPTTGLPLDVLQEVISFLDPDSLNTLSQTCRAANQACKHGQLHWKLRADRLGYNEGQEESHREFIQLTIARVKECMDRWYFPQYHRYNKTASTPGQPGQPPSLRAKASTKPTKSASIFPTAYELMETLANHPKGNQLPKICPWIRETNPPAESIPLRGLESQWEVNRLLQSAIDNWHVADLMLAARLGATVPGDLLNRKRRFKADRTAPQSGRTVHISWENYPVERLEDRAWLKAILRFQSPESPPSYDPVVVAARNHNHKAIRVLAEAGMGLDGWKETDPSPLQLAIKDYLPRGSFGPYHETLQKDPRWHQTKTLETLIALGANVNLQKKAQLTALEEACACKREDFVDLLLAAGADANRGIPLVRACENGATACAERLLKAGASMEQAAEDGQRAIHAAAVVGANDCLKLLAQKGADPNALGKDGDSALAQILSSDKLTNTKRSACLKTILEAGAIVDLPILLRSIGADVSRDTRTLMSRHYFLCLESRHPHPLDRLSALQETLEELEDLADKAVAPMAMTDVWLESRIAPTQRRILKMQNQLLLRIYQGQELIPSR